MSMIELHHKKCRRYNVPGHAHELTFSCYKQRPFLRSERACRYLAEAIIRAKKQHAFDLWAYVFMPEHVHLLIRPTSEDYSVSSMLQSIKQSVPRRILLYLRKNNPEGLRCLATNQKHRPYRFWQDGGGYDRNIISREAVLAAIKYIHENPVRRGLVSEAEDWTWSSAGNWNGTANGMIPVDIDSLHLL